MKIRYLGHSCFQLTESTGTSIVCDPYGDVGFDMPSVEADAVTVSHAHYDHDNAKAVGGNPVVFSKEGQYEIGGVAITAVKSYHDDELGKERGENLIFKFRMDGVEVCHLGDLGEECSAELIEALLPVHVLLIPVGGTYTIDAASFPCTIKPGGWKWISTRRTNLPICSRAKRSPSCTRASSNFFATISRKKAPEFMY